MREQSLSMLAARTGQSLERVTVDSSRQFYLDAAQAVDYGIADRIMERDGLRGMTGLGEMPDALRSEVRGIA
jgi:ATP-dependent Clp protease protease subunit